MKTLIAIAGMFLAAGVASAAPGGIPGPPWLPGDGGNGGDATATTTVEANVSSSASSEVEVNLGGSEFGGDTNISQNYRLRLPASSAADLMLANCQKGASAQGFGGGGSIGSTDEVCHLFALYALHEARGDLAAADQVLEEITDIMKIRTNPVRRAFQALPLIGNIF